MPPASEPQRRSSRIAHAARWLVSGEWRPALAVGLVFVAYMFTQFGSISGLASESKLITVAACLLIFGVFLGVVFVTEIKEVKESVATRRCVITGCIACSAIAIILGGGTEGIVLGFIVGAFLGYTAPWWSRAI